MKKGQKKGLVCGIGINDLDCMRATIAYNKWKSMLERCYVSKVHAKRPTYICCYVCEEWLTFSNFKKWFDENYQEDTVLDKDIILKNNHVYSPQTCCFVPTEINALLTNRKNHRGNYPQGVTMQRWNNCTRYYASISKNGKKVKLGCYKTPLEAFFAYKSAKEHYVKELATKYFQEGKITQRVYQALMEYQVEITD